MKTTMSSTAARRASVHAATRASPSTPCVSIRRAGCESTPTSEPCHLLLLLFLINPMYVFTLAKRRPAASAQRRSRRERRPRRRHGRERARARCCCCCFCCAAAAISSWIDPVLQWKLLNESGSVVAALHTYILVSYSSTHQLRHDLGHALLLSLPRSLHPLSPSPLLLLRRHHASAGRLQRLPQHPPPLALPPVRRHPQPVGARLFKIRMCVCTTIRVNQTNALPIPNNNPP